VTRERPEPQPLRYRRNGYLFTWYGGEYVDISRAADGVTGQAFEVINMMQADGTLPAYAPGVLQRAAKEVDWAALRVAARESARYPGRPS
jgi:hypothetical protein